MRTSQYLIATLKETPADAEIISHQLMLRAGLIRKLASGLYSWLPMGLRALRKVEKIIREEMDQSCAQELLMPAIQSAELWKESGRWDQYGAELLRLTDRHNRDFCVGPTHEEVITDLVRNELKSYKSLPATFYQIQTKFRDERRPRFGVMRAREFIMKDAYSFHINLDSLNETYDLMYDTYNRIFTRLGLDYRPVQADSGSIGGNASHEFHVLAGSGEDEIVFSTASDYAANMEKAIAIPPAEGRPKPLQKKTEIATPHQRSIEEICQFLKVRPQNTIKTLIVHAENIENKSVENDENNQNLIALIVRGDHTLNELKAEKLHGVASPLTLASDDEIRAIVGCEPGFIGPVGLHIPYIIDESAACLNDFICGANKPDAHLMGVNWDRDCDSGRIADIRNVVEGDPSPDGKGTLTIKRGIEVGHIFKLGNKYTQSMNATVLDETGRAVIMEMGCYGIGVSRIVAAAIEQNHDEKGIIWPEAIAPFNLAIVPLNMHKSEEVSQKAESLHTTFSKLGLDVLLDDRNERPGVKFSDMELLGIPHRIVISDRGLTAGKIEYKGRTDESSQDIPADEIIDFITGQCHQ